MLCLLLLLFPTDIILQRKKRQNIDGHPLCDQAGQYSCRIIRVETRCGTMSGASCHQSDRVQRSSDGLILIIHMKRVKLQKVMDGITGKVAAAEVNISLYRGAPSADGLL